MSSELDALPDRVRAKALKMREMVDFIESAQLSEVVKAVALLKAEIEAVIEHANAASGRRV
jgi:hypothetical protein